MSSCARSSWGRPTASSPSSPRATARSARWPRASASPGAGSAPGSSPPPTSRSSATGAAASSTSSPRSRRSTPTAQLRESYGCLTHAVSMLEAADQVAQDREPNAALYRMLVGALRTLAAEPSAAGERGVLLEAALARGLPSAARRLCALRRTSPAPSPPSTSTRAGCSASTCGRLGGRRLPARGARAAAAGSSAASCGARSPSRPSATTTDVERLALAAVEHHLERRLRSAPCSDSANGRRVLGTVRSAKRVPATIDCSMAKPDLMDRVVNLAKRRGLRLPLERDLRRLPVHLGLRAARRAAQAQRQGRLVALDGAAPRRHRRPRRRDPHGAEGLGGERPPRDLHRPARRLPQLQGAVPRRPAARVGRVPELRRQGHRSPRRASST